MTDIVIQDVTAAHLLLCNFILVSAGIRNRAKITLTVLWLLPCRIWSFVGAALAAVLGRGVSKLQS
ncbi:MAG: hypothetical protein EA399_13280 [Desulfovibrionales bacterium]|nr:MAG: hypothetical protein EA399_13280 [Desulfovibrionales bacterium]